MKSRSDGSIAQCCSLLSDATQLPFDLGGGARHSAPQVTPTHPRHRTSAGSPFPGADRWGCLARRDGGDDVPRTAAASLARAPLSVLGAVCLPACLGQSR